MMAGIVQLLDTAGLWLLDAVLRVTIDGALVALPVWLACRFLPTLSASARAWLWWGVSLKLLLSLTAAPSLSIPVLPATWSFVASESSPAPRAIPTTPASRSSAVAGARTPETPAPGSLQNVTTSAGLAAGSPSRESTPARWVLLRMAAAGWMIVAIGQFTLLARDAWRLRRIVRRATRPAAAIEDQHEDLAKDLGLRRIPALRESPDVAAPQVVGLLRPTVLLPPASATPMSPHERTMVLCHELAHVRRGDLILGWIPALAERVLVWHPLARLAGREYALAREAACDALVLRTLDTAPRDYGRLLVRLGVHAPAVRVAAAGTSPTAQLLRRRLHMLQHASLSPRALSGVIITAAVVALVPLRLVGVAPLDPVPPLTGGSSAASTPTRGPDAHGEVSASAASQREREQERERDSRDRHKEHSWIYLDDGSDGAMMNGDTGDLKLARRLRGSKSGPFLIYRRDGEIFTIDDRQTLERVEAIFEPQRKLGEQQGELGARQGELGAEQGKLGERQGMLGAQQGEIGLRHAEISAQMAEVHVREQRIRVERLRKGVEDRPSPDVLEAETRAKMGELERQMRELADKQDALGRQQEAIGRDQEALGARQEALGAEQEKLGEQQERAARQAERELRELVEGAIASGVAKRVK
jgi:bla regulator protein BlaR1